MKKGYNDMKKQKMITKGLLKILAVFAAFVCEFAFVATIGTVVVPVTLSYLVGYIGINTDMSIMELGVLWIAPSIFFLAIFIFLAICAMTYITKFFKNGYDKAIQLLNTPTENTGNIRHLDTNKRKLFKKKDKVVNTES